jgi:pimeloyl-ACP methyl ester carboxylesterase
VNSQIVSKSFNSKSVPISIPDWANYHESGSGSPVILVHGLAASLYDWESIMPELASSNYHGYALDLLGHGDSPKPETRSYKVKWVLRHFEKWIQSLDLSEPPILIGHSLGSYLVLRYTLRHIQTVRGIVLISPLFSVQQLPPILRRTYRHPTLNALVMERLPRWVFQVAVDFTSQTLGRIGHGTHDLPPEIRFQTALDYKRTHPGAFNIPNTVRDLTSELHRIEQPALVIWGERDLTLNPVMFPGLVEALPNARGIPFPFSGHVLHQSHSKQFNKLVLDFLNSL